MIDLHLHTTASDGRCSPEDLVRELSARGIRTFSVTDHDTMAGVAPAAAAGSALGLTCIPGIEITSVDRGKDVHVLAYFLPELSDDLRTLLATQRRNRLARARAIADRLAAAGAPVDLDPLINAAGDSGKALARPQIAQALIAAGHVRSVAEAFERFLGEAGPAYVPHTGASPAEIVVLIGQAGGMSSLAHPGYTNRDEIIPDLVAAGLHAIEAYHSSHHEGTATRYVSMARELGLTITGGSDYHGHGTRRAEFLGVTHLPQGEFDRLTAARDALREAGPERWAAGQATG